MMPHRSRFRVGIQALKSFWTERLLGAPPSRFTTRPPERHFGIVLLSLGLADYFAASRGRSRSSHPSDTPMRPTRIAGLPWASGINMRDGGSSLKRSAILIRSQRSLRQRQISRDPAVESQCGPA